jgi:rhodanese-related sulfurtransferase/Fe-S cluster assembly iron-binding protein IscA
MLYVNGHLMGGGRLLKQLADSGQLGRLVEQPINRLPKIAASSLAIAQLKRALKSPTNVVRLTISDELCHDLCVDEVRPRDIELVIGELTLVLDQSSASRADGVAIDWIERPEGSGFRIDNSNVVAASRSVDCAFLAEWLAGPVPPLLIDARTEEEYLAGRLPEARLLDAELLDALLLLDRRTSLAFYCKNGTRSDRAARHHKELGFVDVATLAGGFDAWKRHFGQQRATSRL